MTDENDAFARMTKIAQQMRSYSSGPIVGSAKNPYTLHVPGWAEDRAIAEGTTCQEVANKTFRYHVKVIVVR